MKSLVDVVYAKTDAGQPASESLAVSTQAGIKVAAVAILGATLGVSKASTFAEEASNLVTYKQFLGELESESELPKSGETEDEFVVRAKEAMFKMLQGKLK